MLIIVASTIMFKSASLEANQWKPVASELCASRLLLLDFLSSVYMKQIVNTCSDKRAFNTCPRKLYI